MATEILVNIGSGNIGLTALNHYPILCWLFHHWGLWFTWEQYSVYELENYTLEINGTFPRAKQINTNCVSACANCQCGVHHVAQMFFSYFCPDFFLHVSPCLLISCCWRHGVVMLTHRDFSLSHFLSKDALDGPSRISWNQMRLHHHFCSLLSAWFHREQTCGTCTSETRGARAPAHDGLTLW